MLLHSQDVFYLSDVEKDAILELCNVQMNIKIKDIMSGNVQEGLTEISQIYYISMHGSAAFEFELAESLKTRHTVSEQDKQHQSREVGKYDHPYEVA